VVQPPWVVVVVVVVSGSAIPRKVHAKKPLSLDPRFLSRSFSHQFGNVEIHGVFVSVGWQENNWVDVLDPEVKVPFAPRRM